MGASRLRYRAWCMAHEHLSGGEPMRLSGCQKDLQYLPRASPCSLEPAPGNDHGRDTDR